MGVLKPIFSKEEKEEIKQVILDMISESHGTIAAKVGVDKKTVQNYIKELIEEGRTSKEAIEEAKARKKKEEWEKKKSIILAGVHEGETLEKLEKGANVDKKTLRKILQELVDERNDRKRICGKKEKRSTRC